MKTGTRIAWIYRHSYNSRSSSMRIKKGVYHGKVNHTKRWKGEQLAVVTFNGNKTTSKVPYDELEVDIIP